MKKLSILLMLCVLFGACSSLGIGPKGEGEYVIAESLVPYDEKNIKQMKKDGILEAQKLAVEKVAGVFISSATTVEQNQLIEDKIVSKTAGFIRHSRVQKAYRKGDEFYTKIKAMVLVKDIGDIIKQSEADSFAKKTTIFVASREVSEGNMVLRQDCKQAIYKALKSNNFALLNGDNLSQNNIEAPNSVIDKARSEGARFVILADVETDPLEALTSAVSPFKTYRARANIRAYATNNYAMVAEGAYQASGIDPLPAIASQKSIASSCEAAAKQLTDPLNAAINSAKIFNVVVKDISSIERLKQVQDIFKNLREIEDFNLVKYANSSAQFEISANIATTEELTAKVIRKYSVNFTVNTITPSHIILSFN